MFRFPFALLCALLVISTVDYAVARKSFGYGGRHSYPKSSGHSGAGSHSYPSNGGLSGGSHGYPSSGGSHGYPSSGGSGSHSYPASSGMSGHGSAGSSNTHHSGSHGYPASTGLSGNKPASSVTNVHHHYHYSPPQQISYASHVGAAPVSYPVYHGTPPTYVYQYKDSGSKYGTLLTGLALLNLGTLAAGTAYAYSHSHSNSNSNYRTQPGELCKFGVKKANGDYEETKIDCQLMSSFIFQEEASRQGASTGTNTTTVITSVTNVTTINATGPNEAPAAVPEATNITGTYNGTLVPNTTDNHTATDMRSDATSNNNVTSSVVVTQTNTTTTVTNALDVKGKPIDVTPGMECYVIRTTPSSRLRKSVPCGLLQTYAEKSISRNSASRAAPSVAILAAILTALIVY